VFATSISVQAQPGKARETYVKSSNITQSPFVNLETLILLVEMMRIERPVADFLATVRREPVSFGSKYSPKENVCWLSSQTSLGRTAVILFALLNMRLLACLFTSIGQPCAALQRSSFSLEKREILAPQSEEWLRNRSGYAVVLVFGRV
jgi:hypothetical protein